MHVTLIANPPFLLDLREVKNDNEVSVTLREKVHKVAISIFTHLKILGISMYQSLATNSRYLWTTFRYIVLGFNGRNYIPATNGTNLAIRCGLWALAHTIGFIYYTVVLFLQNVHSLPSYLLKYAPRELDTSHLTAKNTAIDVSGVPEEIQVSNLLSLYRDINFSNSEQPGYMSPASRKEGSITYSVYDLRTNLETFVNNVNERKAFLGTPPAYMAPQLMKFYQKIQDAVRFTMHKVTKDYDDFMTAHQGQALTKEHPDYQQYNNLLEDKARLAIDMAIAGAHCGARYMGDSVDAYLAIQGDLGDKTQGLQAKLSFILAKERETIARGDIARHLGHDTHAFSSYMANMGSLLGIPGSEDIIEYLSGWRFNRHKYLTHFFETYTPDRIRQRVQNEIKSSQSFREATFDWLQDQVKDWKKAEYIGRVNDVLSSIKPINPGEQSPYFAKIQQFIGLVQKLKETGALSAEARALMPNMDDNYVDFMDDLFTLQQAKEHLATLFPGNVMQIMQSRNALKSALIKPEVRDELKKIIAAICADTPVELDSIKKISITLDKVASVNTAISRGNFPTIDETVLFRALENNTNLQTILQDHTNRQRKVEFLDALMQSETNQEEESAVTVTRDGLKEPVLNWILVANKILK